MKYSQLVSHLADTLLRRFSASERSEAVSSAEYSVKLRGWSAGVFCYARELLQRIIEDRGLSYDSEVSPDDISDDSLRGGADSWKDYSFGGSSLVYDADVAERLCSKSEFKLCNGGERDPNPSESWLACQARALLQASNAIRECAA